LTQSPQHPAPPADDEEHRRIRKVLKAVLIGLGAFAVAIAIPLLIVVILAIVAQLIISGH
jgi:uncharacterized membrane protein